jgi:redox-sensitive bicupin YhaK (pirin superfamily)
VISGAVHGAAGRALTNWPVSGTLISLEPGRSLDHVLPARDRVFLYVLSGEVTVGGRAVRAGQIAWSDPVPGNMASVIDLSTSDGYQPSTIMVYRGQPIGQPVSMGGPFVMNTTAEITQAFSDFHAPGQGPPGFRAHRQGAG